MYRAEAGKGCFFKEGCEVDLGDKPKEDENTRVISAYHTHPVIAVDIEELIELGKLKDSDDTLLKLEGYEFTDINYDYSELEHLHQPSDADIETSILQGVPDIIVAGDGSNMNRYNMVVAGAKKNPDGSEVPITKPVNLTWECEACIEIVPIESCPATEETLTLLATVKGPEDKRVTWAATAGTIGEDGIYQAPETPTTETVIATSVADPEHKDTLTFDVGCECEWNAIVLGDVSDEFSGKIASYADSSGIFYLEFLSGPDEDDWPKLGAFLEGGIPTDTGTYDLNSFSFVGGVPGPALSGGTNLIEAGLNLPVTLQITSVGEKVITGIIDGTLKGLRNPQDPKSEINAIITLKFTARLREEGKYACPTE